MSTGRFGTKSNFVPLAGATPDGDDVRADVTKDQVKSAGAGAADRETGGARLRRHVVTERVIVETPGAPREPGTRRPAGGETSGDDPLHGERFGDAPTSDDRI